MKKNRFYCIVSNMKYPLLALVLVVLISVTARAADIKFIANYSVNATAVSMNDIKDVFLLNKDSVGGSHVQPVLSKGGPAHEIFVKKYLDKNDSAVQAYFRSLVFTGKATMPRMLGSDAEIVSYVASTKGAMAYVNSDVDSPGVKTLQVQEAAGERPKNAYKR